ncbi:tetracycline efflux MFS transporter TetA(P) [Planotetraspora phitsanulokensis]|uniref:Tetracycline efflux MFS transporter TetA(P) n=1 Tax=Planotetraspora phitsanulokensis TaxID=575192 RepID=A0A8J3U4D0_9ACTN|nr:MFS transporter [Planotetraspora phitsanulokensis]GII36976.1 tetracycline efflux MFS transporter TetA(P) [Planotetraspora phitsanulokensis]
MRASVTYLIIRGSTAFAGSCAFTLNLVYQAQVAGLGPLQLVLVGTTLEVVCLLAQVPTGVLADLRSRKQSVVVGYLLFGTGVLIEGMAPHFWAILAANAVLGVGWTFVDGAQDAWVVDEVGPGRVSLLLVRGAQLDQAATVAGIGASVWLAGFGLNVPLVVGAAVWLVLGVVLAAAMPELEFRPEARHAAWRGSLRSMRDQAGRAVATARRSRPMRFMLVAVLLAAFASEGFDRLGQVHFIQSWSTSPYWFGVMAVAAMAGAAAVTELVRRLTDLTDPARTARALAVLQALGVVATAVFALTGQFWVAVLAWAGANMARSAAEPARAAWLARLTEPASRATAYSLFSQADAAGELTGGPPLGLLAQRVSIGAALAGSAATLGLTVPFLATAGRGLPAAGPLGDEHRVVQAAPDAERPAGDAAADEAAEGVGGDGDRAAGSGERLDRDLGGSRRDEPSHDRGGGAPVHDLHLDGGRPAFVREQTRRASRPDGQGPGE